MQTTKKKPSVIFILLGAVLAGFLGYLIGGAWHQGIDINEFLQNFNVVCAKPFANYYNENTIKFFYLHRSKGRNSYKLRHNAKKQWLQCESYQSIGNG